MTSDILRLRSGIGYCRFDDCTIVLDVEADRYWQLESTLGDALATIDSKDATAVPRSVRDRLLALCLVESGPRSVDPRRDLPRVARSALEARRANSRIRPLMAIEVIGTTLATVLGLRWRGLAAMLAAVERRHLRATTKGVELVALAEQFRRYRRWLPMRPICLPDSLAYLAFVARRGHRPTLVFGVEAHPFAAHCWVQSGEVVLNDALDHATLFSPILRI